MKSIGEVIQLSSQFLQERKIERPRRIVEELLSHALKLKRIDLYLQHDRPLLESELTSLRDMLKRSAKGEPLEYILEEVEFFGGKFKVNSHVLIPRPETELLVEMVAKKAKQGTLWDLCTGSGCIGISLKRACPNLQVTLSDISKEALAVARENAKGLEVEILEGDLWAPFQGKKADFIVCNPPYISAAEYASLDPSVKDFEPKMALLAGERGLEFYERIAQGFKSYLKPSGTLFLEIGYNQGPQILQIFERGTVFKDLAGHDRFFVLE